VTQFTEEWCQQSMCLLAYDMCPQHFLSVDNFF